MALSLTFAFPGAVMAEENTAEETTEAASDEADASEDADVKSEGVMTHDEYLAAAVDDEVVVETYVQAKQSWWEDKATIYTQDKTVHTSSTTCHAHRKNTTSWYLAPRSK